MEIRENGNEKSDISTAKNIQPTVASLVADNKLDIDQADIEVTSGGTIASNLQDAPEVRSAKGKAKGSSYHVSIDARGNITVYVGSVASANEIYPNNEIFK